MKKTSLLLLIFVLLTAFQCEDEPLEGEFYSEEEAQCLIANDNTNEASFNFDNANDLNYSELCNAYKAALQAQIEICGDENGSLQFIIDNLGNCINVSETDGIISVTIGTLEKTFEENINVEQIGTLLRIRAEDDLTDDWIRFEVELSQTGVDIIQNFVLHLISSDYIPTSNGAGTFTSEITVNNGMSIEGTFSGPVESSTAGDLSLTQGIITISY